MRFALPCCFFLLLGGGQFLLAVEYPLRSDPVDIDPVMYSNGQRATFIDWGDLSESVRRRPERVREEFEGLRQWLLSPEMISEFEAFGTSVAEQIQPYIQKRMAGFITEYQSRPRPTAAVTKQGETRHNFSLPEGMWHLPEIQRRLYRTVIYDDRDPRQRAYVQAVTASDKADARRTVAVAIAWTSAADRDRYWKDRGQVTLIPMPDDNYLRYFDATSVPVVAWIGADFQTMEIQEGLPVEFVIYRDGDEIPRYRTPRD